jgi:PPP family 3-phenylpropionic acid transporter
MTSELPYWRLSSFYFFFFAIVGALVPYWGPFLRTHGFTAEQIGELFAILNISRIVAPNVWGSLADRSGRHMRLVRLAAVLAAISFGGVFVDQGYLWLMVVTAAFSFFWNGALPQFEANTMNHLGAHEHYYSRIRLWGSIGFIVAVVLLGALVDRLGAGVVPYAVFVCFLGMWLSAQVTPEQPGVTGHEQSGDFWRVLRRPDVIGFFIAAFLSQMSHGPYYAFFSIYLQEHGYSGDLIGLLWAWGVVAEIGVFMLIHRWLPRYGPRWLMVAALLLGGVRWFAIGAFPETLWLLFAAQTLHAASFGIYHAVGIAVVTRFFRGRSQGRGQAVYSSMTFGAGVALGSLVAGYLWSPFGGSAVFYLAGATSVLAAVFAYRAVPNKFAVPAVQQ